jgi:glyoxylase-like metal-dependent hydrolase (beta-lactamase superfamily II)
MTPIKITERNIMFNLHRPFKNMDFDLNLGLILGRRHNFIIDTGFGSGSVVPVLDYIGDDAKPLIVINTHSHWDHVWGNCMFEKSAIIAHPLWFKFAERDWDNDMQKFSQYVHGEARKCPPNLTFDGVLHFPEDGVHIFHSPGHTADCISVFHESDKILYVGDNVGDTADEPVPYIETDIPTFERLIETYKKYPFETCISGHNTPQGKEILARMSSSLEESWKRQVAKYGMPV